MCLQSGLLLTVGGTQKILEIFCTPPGCSSIATSYVG